jgi:hypothetical protein
MGACNTPLNIEEFSSGILKAHEFLKFELINQENKSAFV